MKILFVAYYFDPFPGVGAKRVSYWANNLRTINNDFDVTVITATEQIPEKNNESINVIWVADSRKGAWARIFKSDFGSSWGDDLIRYFSTSNRQYDVILFSGGPFLHFRIARKLKKRMGARIIFDFRDPMTMNPRANLNLSGRLKQRVVRLIERKIVNQCDALISVNKWCLKLIAGWNTKKSICIDNGFDESVVGSLDSKPLLPSIGKIRIAYAGKLARDRDPMPFLRVLMANEDLSYRYSFVYMGESEEQLDSFRGLDWFTGFGIQEYSKTLQILRDCDFLCLFSLGHPFESTTKIFDYIGLGKPIIIFANTKREEGALDSILKNYGQGCWVLNNEDSIADFLRNVLPNMKVNANNKTELFARRHGLEKLVSFIESEMYATSVGTLAEG